ncbi:MAG TPA: SusC/RagA family TonB-linked outer membrane protein [Cyclobacteriaceae bacterium]|nr:SusC/RagA family TonB-linked outer membrane protein [Cyclobacteriaceae bacterium]
MQRILVLFLIVCLSSNLYAQKVHVNGIITENSTGLPLPGATIQIKNSPETSVTDRNGSFRMYALPGDELEVKFVGFVTKTIIAPADERILHITMDEDVRLLNEVVVTGALGIRRAARELGGGAQVVNNENLNQGKTINPITGLTSKVAGLRINMYDSKVDPQVQVVMRGTRSLNRQANAPIYVVDGIPVPDISRINPNDIESITVLKDANAAALYGSEGVNGALMITTKKGTAGNERVTFSNTTTFSKVFLLPKAQTEFGQGQNGVYDRLQSESWGPRFDGTMQDFGPLLPDGTQPQIRYAAPDRDNRLDLFQTGVNFQNDLSFSGGDEKSTYFFSLQDVSIKGILPGDKSRRTGARFNGSRKFGKLSTSYNINYIKFNKEMAPDGPWLSAYTSPANIDFSQMKDWENPTSNANPLYYFTDQVKNPFFLLDNYRQNTGQNTINGKVELDYEFTPWFSAMYRLGIYNLTEESHNTTGKFAASGRRNVNGSVTDGSNNFQRFNGDLILNFNKQIGRFTNRLLLGQNFRSDYTRTISVGADNLLLPGIFNPDSRVGELSSGSGSSITEYRSIAAYGEFTTGYNNYLFLTLTGRNDWVSVLSENNRSYFYPGVSTSFIFNEAIPSLKDSRKLTFGKIFASWNRTGNVTLDPYKLNNPYSQINGFPFGNLVGFTPSSAYPNPDIKPEFVTSYEIGTQLSFFDHRLHFEGSYIYSDSEGQIFNATTSRATGYSTAIVNAGRLTNNIIELNVNSDIVSQSDMKWNLGFTFSHIKNEVRELYEGDSYNIFRQSYANVGQAYPSLMVSDYKRDGQGRIVINGETGYPVLADSETHLGSMVPPYQMGLSSFFEYKGLSIGAQFDSRFGGWLYSEIIPRQYTAGTHPNTAAYGRQPFIYPNSVIEQADGTFVPNTTVLSPGDKAFWDYEGKIQRNTATKSDFLKLRELSISYSLPASLLGGQKYIKDATLGLVGTNLFIIRHVDNDHGDPEYLYNSTDGYVSFRQVPPYRTYGFNVNLTF